MILKIAIWLYSRPQQECAFSGTHFSRIKDFRENYFFERRQRATYLCALFLKGLIFCQVCMCGLIWEVALSNWARVLFFCRLLQTKPKKGAFLYFRERKKAPTTPDGEKLIIVLDKHNWAFEKRNRENKLLDKITTLCESRAFFDGRKVHEVSCNGKRKIQNCLVFQNRRR